MSTVTESTQRFVADDIVEHVDGRWHFVGVECSGCGAHFFPKVQICSLCLSRELTRVHCARTGRLHSFSTVRMAPPGFAAPYRLAWADLDDGVRAFGQLVPADGSEPPVGAPVEVDVVVVRRDADGTEVFGPAFRLVEEG